MAEFSIDQPSADEGHEAIRVAVLQAIADLVLSLDLSDTLFILASEVLEAVASLQTARDQFAVQSAGMAARLGELEARIAALEPPPESPPVEEPVTEVP